MLSSSHHLWSALCNLALRSPWPYYPELGLGRPHDLALSTELRRRCEEQYLDDCFPGDPMAMASFNRDALAFASTLGPDAEARLVTWVEELHRQTPRTSACFSWRLAIDQAADVTSRPPPLAIAIERASNLPRFVELETIAPASEWDERCHERWAQEGLSELEWLPDVLSQRALRLAWTRMRPHVTGRELEQLLDWARSLDWHGIATKTLVHPDSCLLLPDILVRD